MSTALLIIQIFLSLFLIVAVLLQAQGSGLGTTWTGGGETYHTRRGVEKTLLYLTIAGLIGFVLTSIALLLV